VPVTLVPSCFKTIGIVIVPCGVFTVTVHGPDTLTESFCAGVEPAGTAPASMSVASAVATADIFIIEASSMPVQGSEQVPEHPVPVTPESDRAHDEQRERNQDPHVRFLLHGKSLFSCRHDTQLQLNGR
jgi:hypothetical protein